MQGFVVKVLVAGGVMGVLDAVWLGVIASKFYKSQVGSLLLEKPNMAAAVIFYLIYIVGIVVFVLTPALEKDSWQHAVGYGALFGFVAYATYDLTNLATLKGWTTTLVIVDLLWGAALTATVAGVSYWIISHL
ncbi:MAG: DUF2177 family protein [Candidatus Saccharimonadales bacterium]